MSILAPNRLNTLSFPLLVLRLMKSNADPVVVELPFGMFRVYVPSNHGGRLTIGFGAARADAEHVLFVDAPDGARTRMDANQRVRIEITPGLRGDGIYTAYVSAPSGAYSIYATFDEIGFAREKDGTPLVPWNFWYFPYSHEEDGNAWGGKIVQPLAKYEAAFGKNGAMAWELEHHGDPTKSRQKWEGHCHDAASASILFTEPPENGVEHNGVRIRCEELKFFAAEFFGQFCEAKRKWALPGTNESDKKGPYVERRPSDFSELFGGAQALGTFLIQLRAWIRDAGMAVRMDVRDEYGVDHTEMWNHAVYRYRTQYWQSDPDDLSLVDAQMELNANGDFLLPDGSSSGAPADIITTSSGEMQPTPNGTGRDQLLQFRVRFDPGGVMDPASADNRWSSVRKWNKLAKTNPLGPETFAPRSLSIIEHPRHEPEVTSGGNPHIQREAVLALLPLREVFR